MRTLIENQLNFKLTKAQQKFVAENERLIGYVSYKRFRFQGNNEIYEFCYGYAAVGLCQAAKIYDPRHDGTFAGLACRCIYMAICQALRIWYKDRAKQPLSLNQVVDEKGHEFGELIPAPGEFEPLEYKILAESVYQKVESVLGDKDKEIFRLWLHGRAEIKIARAMGISYGSVKVRICRAKKQCRASFNYGEIFS